MFHIFVRPILLLAAAGVALSACAGAGAGQGQSLMIYSGRSEDLVGPVIEQFRQASGIDVQVRYGSTPELAATLLEEGRASPADVFFAQDPGGLGAVAAAGLLAELPQETLERVPARWRDPAGQWVGLSGRARVVAYNTDRIDPDSLPGDIWDFTDPVWQGRLAWAPTNASFQAMVTAMRASWGEEMTRRWLEGILANRPIAYENNTALVQAVAAGEVEVGFTNHYYLQRFIEEQGLSFSARPHFLSGAGPGSLVMVAGAGRLAAARNGDNAIKFINFMLSPVAQQYFASQTFEYPVTEGVKLPPELIPLDALNALQIELSALADLTGTVTLLNQVGALP
jgi:iron(III) transport system substrate-binding protein